MRFSSKKVLALQARLAWPVGLHGEKNLCPFSWDPGIGQVTRGALAVINPHRN